MQNIEKNLSQVRQLIRQSEIAHGRTPGSVLLLAVSTKKPASDIRAAWQLGQRDFGENYLQEARQKIQELKDLDITWHFIGAIQSNKTRSIAEVFDWVHCIDRLKIAQRLSTQRPPSMQALNICIQVNLDEETSKAGISLDAVPDLAEKIHNLPNIRLRGLMAIPAPSIDFERQRLNFTRLADALQTLRERGIACDTLSMGMTQDMSAAIAAGSTLVRIGSAIFGERS